MTISVLIIEDVDHKFEDVLEALDRFFASKFEHTRAKTIVDADARIQEGGWDLAVVDISIDIIDTPGGMSRETHANLGGMDLIEQMYLSEREVPTVIVTGFDYFVRGSSESETTDAQTFADLEMQARAWLADDFLGCIRYGEAGWRDLLTQALQVFK